MYKGDYKENPNRPSVFCRRCYTHGCDLHGFQQPTPKEIKVRPLFWFQRQSHLCDERCWKKSSNNNKPSKISLSEWQQSVVLSSLRMFGIDYCSINRFLNFSFTMEMSCGQSYRLVRPWIQAAQADEKVETFFPRTRVNLEKRIADMEKRLEKWNTKEDASFVPCKHEGSCLENIDCNCLATNHFCEKSCACSDNCANRFRGCDCHNGQICQTRECACYVASRECDPDYCHNCTADIIGTDKLRCLNVGIQLGKHKLLYVAQSEVHGRGLFAGCDIAQDAYICEYVGDLISQNEAMRRQISCETLGLNYLFDVSKDLIIDAAYRGNIARFANHTSEDANAESRIVNVLGDYHVALYADKHIKKGEEILFNYNSTTLLKTVAEGH